LTLAARAHAAPILGNLEILVADRAFLQTTLRVDDGEIGLYRSEDGVVASVPPTAEGILGNCLPIFRTFVASDFTEENATFAAYVGDVCAPEIKNLLFAVASAFPEFVVGFLGPSLHPLLEQATLREIHRIPLFVVFTIRTRSFCPFLENNLTLASISTYLRAVINGSLERSYHSEPVPEHQPTAWTKLVGQTYADFMSDADHDLFLLYTRPNSEECREAIEEFVKAAEALSRRGVRFATIDVFLNSAPLPFPKMLKQPHLRFFPAVNRSWGFPFMHRISRDDISRFVKHFGSRDYGIQVPPKSKREFKREVRAFAQIYPKLPEEDQGTMSDYFHKMWFTLGLGSGITRED
jgi:hypothetical protein